MIGNQKYLHFEDVTSGSVGSDSAVCLIKTGRLQFSTDKSVSVFLFADMETFILENIKCFIVKLNAGLTDGSRPLAGERGADGRLHGAKDRSRSHPPPGADLQGDAAAAQSTDSQGPLSGEQQHRHRLPEDQGNAPVEPKLR